ncbi:hypothetical protein N8600_07610 [Gammaproteobacteria bacterium]|nr:hypothetical protein [Gammaproteobacteria bacterium]
MKLPIKKLHPKRVLHAMLGTLILAAGFSTINTDLVLAANNEATVPVSINALMVTMVDHSAHHIWDFQAQESALTDEQWQVVEYFGIQLAGAGPLLTLGGNGPQDNAWASSEVWFNYSQAMSNAAMLAVDAAKNKNTDLLYSASDALLVTCVGCHSSFKPESPTEGILHNPEYDHLYHLFQ